VARGGPYAESVEELAEAAARRRVNAERIERWRRREERLRLVLGEAYKPPPEPAASRPPPSRKAEATARNGEARAARVRAKVAAWNGQEAALRRRLGEVYRPPAKKAA
jgi:hypothetical protein